MSKHPPCVGHLYPNYKEQGGVRQCLRIYVVMDQGGVRQCLRIYVVMDQGGVRQCLRIYVVMDQEGLGGILLHRITQAADIGDQTQYLSAGS